MTGPTPPGRGAALGTRLGRRRTDSHPEAPLAQLVALGLTYDAVERVRTNPPRADVLDEAIREMRDAGFELDADVVHLVGTNPAAGTLLHPPWLDHHILLRVVSVAVLAAWSALASVNIWLGLVIPGSLVAALLVWFSSQRNRLDRGERQVLRRWRRSRLATATPSQRRVGVAAGLAAGFLAVLLGIEDPAAGITIGVVAALVLLVAWSPWRLPDSDGGRPYVARPTTGVRAGRERSAARPPQAPLEVARPAMGLSGTPAGVLVLVALVLVIQGRDVGYLLSAAAALTVGAWLWWRASRSFLRLDGEGITYRGAFRTRRFRWDRVVDLRAAGDGSARARVEVVLDSGEPVTVWTGSIDDPLLPQIVGQGEARASGVEGARRRGTGCAMAFVVVAAAFAALVSLLVLFDHWNGSVDPSDAPAGVDVWVGPTTPGEASPHTWVECAPPLGGRPDWEPHTCTDARRGQTWTAAGFGALATGLAATAVIVRRRARERDGFPPVGPFAGPPPA